MTTMRLDSPVAPLSEPIWATSMLMTLSRLAFSMVKVFVGALRPTFIGTMMPRISS